VRVHVCDGEPEDSVGRHRNEESKSSPHCGVRVYDSGRSAGYRWPRTSPSGGRYRYSGTGGAWAGNKGRARIGAIIPPSGVACACEGCLRPSRRPRGRGLYLQGHGRFGPKHGVGAVLGGAELLARMGNGDRSRWRTGPSPRVDQVPVEGIAGLLSGQARACAPVEASSPKNASYSSTS
jgi:hypothetical protein